MKSILLAAAVGVGLFSLSANAAPIPVPATLQDLINLNQGNPGDGIPQGGITIGDKLFYDFTYLASGAAAAPYPNPNPNPAPPRADQIAVQSITGPNIGLMFSFGWNSSAGFNMDSLIGYKVHVLDGDPQPLIDSIGLSFNGAAPVPGIGTFATVTETVKSLSGATLGGFSVYSDGTISNLGNTFALATPQRDIQVQKDILVSSVPSNLGGGTSTISFVDNTYHQTAVPEPVSMAVVVLGGALLLRRRGESA
jgi:hypothetical protein